jgi:hypothetical protein
MAKTNCPHCQLQLEQPKTDIDMHWCERCNTPLIACEPMPGEMKWWYMGWDTDTEGYGNGLWCTAQFANLCDIFGQEICDEFSSLTRDSNEVMDYLVQYWQVPAHLEDKLMYEVVDQKGIYQQIKGAVDWLANVNKKGNDR